MSSVRLQRECIATKQLQIGSRGFHYKAAKGLS